MSTLSEVQDAALHLPEAARWQLAECLLESLPPRDATEAEDILAEAETRDLEIESGEVAALNEDAFWAGIRRRKA